MEFEGKVVLITGAGRGFGLATARRFAEEGAHLALNYRNSQGSTEQLAEEIRGKGGRAIAVGADVGVTEQVNQMVDRTIEEYGRIDILINNAGVMNVGTFAESTEDQWNFETNINIYGPLRVTHAVLPHMIEQRYGKIVSLSSQLAHVGWERGAVYAGTKGFILTWTKSLAREVGQYNINVNAIGPGSIMTDMNQVIYGDPEAIKRKAEELPLRRLGSTNDVAECALFLASDASSFLTGQMLGPNGGNVM
jgi:NAD(P)-dependent dehydrogenase (short-subunit alcohol dehydrogenase family)